MPHEKFDVSKLERLNDPARLEYLDPDVMWTALGAPSPRAIVEIGAGTGLFACRFAEMAPQADVYAVDIEPAMVRWMLEHRPPSLCERLHPMLSRETTVPLPTGESDVVIMINLHHELVDPPATYCEALRLLRIGGQLMIADWAPGAPGGPPERVRVDAETIAETLRAVGFADVRVHDALPRHSLLTAEKPAVCGVGSRHE